MAGLSPAITNGRRLTPTFAGLAALFAAAFSVVAVSLTLLALAALAPAGLTLAALALLTFAVLLLRRGPLTLALLLLLRVTVLLLIVHVFSSLCEEGERPTWNACS